MKPIFCILGKTGAGKTTILDRITHPDNTISIDLQISKLIYHTTRKMRDNEVDGEDYHFVPEFGTPEFFEVFNKDEVIEEREYNKYDGIVKYYTTYSDIENATGKAIVCAASVDQAISYYNKLDNVYIISVEAPTAERMKRVLNRESSESDCLELCRRILEETNEYNRIKFFDPEKIFVFDNSSSYDLENGEYSDAFDYKMHKLYEFIESKM